MNRRRRVLEVLAVAAATVIVSVFALQLWRADLDVPFAYGGSTARYLPPDANPLVYPGDAPFYLMVVKTLIDHNSYLDNPSLGAPFEQTTYDLPQGGDHAQLAIQYALGKLLGEPARVVNVYYLLTFPLVAVVAFLVFGRLGISRPTSAAMALLYAFAPYHFARGTAHLLLSGYFLVPVGVLLILRVMSPQPPFTADAPDRARRWRLQLGGRRSLLVVLACIALASTGTYYAVFTVVFAALCGGIVALAHGRLRPLVSGIAIGVVIMAMLVVNHVPSLVYWAANGTNPKAGERAAQETEINGLKPSQLLLPFDGHRVPPLREIADRSKNSRVPSENGQQLGLVAAAGFAALLLVALCRVAGGNLNGRRLLPASFERYRQLSTLTMVALLMGTVGGFSILVAAFGLRGIRSWNRVSLIIGFCSLIAVALFVDAMAARLRARGRGALALGLIAATALIGLADQVTPRAVPKYAANEASWASDRELGRRTTELLGDGAMVVQLPYVRFPEAGVQKGAGPYDMVRGWLHADTLRWSWGAMRGRNGDWLRDVDLTATTNALDRFSAVGFAAVWIDRAAMGDDDFEVLRDAFTRVLGPASIVSPDERFSVFDLRPYATTVRARMSPEALRALADDTLRQPPRSSLH